MKLFSQLVFSVVICISSQASGDLIIRGVVDGEIMLDSNKGDPKALVFEALADIPDLAIYGIEVTANASAIAGQEFGFSGMASTGDLIVVTPNSNHSTYLTRNFASIALTFEAGVGNVNGDDSLILYENSVAIDTYGDPGTDGTGEDWEYKDTFAVRTGGTAGSFLLANYSIAAVSSLDGLDEAETAAALVPLFGPVTAVPEPSAFLFVGCIGILVSTYRRYNP